MTKMEYVFFIFLLIIYFQFLFLKEKGTDHPLLNYLFMVDVLVILIEIILHKDLFKKESQKKIDDYFRTKK